MNDGTPPSINGFQPTEAQLRTLQSFLTADSDTGTIRDMCADAAIHPSTFYRWMQRSEFRQWWNEATEATLHGARAAVLGALTRKAENGDLAAIKVWLQRFDRTDAGDRQSLQDLYRDLIRRFATDEFLARVGQPNDQPPT